MIEKAPVQELRIDPVVSFVIYDFGKVGLDQTQNEPERREEYNFLHGLNNDIIRCRFTEVNIAKSLRNAIKKAPADNVSAGAKLEKRTFSLYADP